MANPDVTAARDQKVGATGEPIRNPLLGKALAQIEARRSLLLSL
jgi:hypothetical protein